MTNEIIYQQCKEIIQPDVTKKLMGWIYRCLLDKSIKDKLFFYDTTNNVITGFVLCRLLKRTNVISIDKFGIHTEYRNTGLGTKLLNKIKKLGYDIKLDVVSKNQKAIKFYKKNGFNIIGEKTLGKTINVKIMKFYTKQKFYKYG